jgi:hypothetical protein
MFMERNRSRLVAYAVALLVALSLAGWGGQSTKARETGSPPGLRASLRTELTKYLSMRRVAEHISAVSLRVTFSSHRRSINVLSGPPDTAAGREYQPVLCGRSAATRRYSRRSSCSNSRPSTSCRSTTRWVNGYPATPPGGG